MLDFGYYNMDCMKGMKQFPDGFFDLAIVDPPYGGVAQGGYMNNKMSGGVAKNRNDYVLDLWNQNAPGTEYFEELFRVSKNQVIWGGTTSSNRSIGTLNVGLYGTKKNRKGLDMRTLNWHGLRSIRHQRYSGSLGTGCFKAI